MLSLQKLFTTKRQRKILAFHEKYFRAMDETLPEDVFIAGYPKSGNTWFQSLASGVALGVLADKGVPRLTADLVPDVHEDDGFYRRYQTPTFFKTHHLPRPAYRNVVYLVRDGRDVMVSYLHHREAIERRRPDFLDMVQNGTGLFPCKWQDHVRQWLQNPYGARMIVIRYEDLLANPVREMERFCEFSGLKVEREFLEQVCAASAFDKLQKREKRAGNEDPNWSKDKLFHRRGVAGSFADEMPPEVQHAFLAEAGDVLKQQGYV
jgi:hypothetical protein